MIRYLLAFLLFAAPAMAAPLQPYNPNSTFGYDFVIPTDPNTGQMCIGSTCPYTPLAGSQYGLALTTVTSLTVPSGAVFATITVETGSVRYSSTGTPTATSGMLLTVGGPYTMAINPLSVVKFIDATASTGTIDVEYFQ